MKLLLNVKISNIHIILSEVPYNNQVLFSFFPDRGNKTQRSPSERQHRICRKQNGRNSLGLFSKGRFCNVCGRFVFYNKCTVREYAFPGVSGRQYKPGRRTGALRSGRDHSAIIMGNRHADFCFVTLSVTSAVLQSI